VALLLETRRLLLRPLVIDDFEAYHAAVGEPPASAGPDAKPSREDSFKRLLANIACWNLFGFGTFAVIDRGTARLIGGCGLFRMERDVEPPLDGSPEAGWGIDRQFHGQGYAHEAMTAALEWFDRTAGEPRSICMIDDGNLASEKLAAKLGYATCATGRYKDVAVTIYARER